MSLPAALKIGKIGWGSRGRLMSALYEESHRLLQRQFDTQRLADRIEPAEFVSPRYTEAQFLVVVDVREVFANCPRYIHKCALVERSQFVPHDGIPTPSPGWKKMDWACDVLPLGDPARSKS
jgi:hypothetical protein